jgi:hypothetical protein
MSPWTTHATFAPRRAKKGERYETMRMIESGALESASETVECLHGPCVRTLKALQDQRRPRPPVAARHAEQVIVGPIRIKVD